MKLQKMKYSSFLHSHDSQPKDFNNQCSDILDDEGTDLMKESL